MNPSSSNTRLVDVRRIDVCCASLTYSGLVDPRLRLRYPTSPLWTKNLPQATFLTFRLSRVRFSKIKKSNTPHKWCARFWWMWGESNSCPKTYSYRHLRAQTYLYVPFYSRRMSDCCNQYLLLRDGRWRNPPFTFTAKMTPYPDRGSSGSDEPPD